MELFFALRVEEENMKIQVFLMSWPDWIHNSNAILGVIFPPKNGACSKDNNSNPVQNLTCINNAPAFSSQSGVRPAPEILYSSRPPHTKMTVVCKAKLPQIIYYILYIIYYILYIIY